MWDQLWSPPRSQTQGEVTGGVVPAQPGSTHPPRSTGPCSVHVCACVPACVGACMCPRHVEEACAMARQCATGHTPMGMGTNVETCATGHRGGVWQADSTASRWPTPQSPDQEGQCPSQNSWWEKVVHAHQGQEGQGRGAVGTEDMQQGRDSGLRPDPEGPMQGRAPRAAGAARLHRPCALQTRRAAGLTAPA